MKKISIFLVALVLGIVACKNEAKDSVEKADSANEAKQDAASVHPTAILTDEESTNFLVKAANYGMAEVQLGKLAQQKAVHQQVKYFAAMLANANTTANEQLEVLAAERKVDLPGTPGNIQKKDLVDMGKKDGSDFDKSYIKTMIRAHNETISLFEQAAGKVNDPGVKTFIDNALPKLRNHLDSAKAIQKIIR